jgi:transposase
MDIKTIGLDIVKNVFRLHGVDVKGKTVLCKQLMRDKLLEFFANVS